MTTPVELEPFTLKHDALKTTFRGVVTLPEVVQFRGIKYASIPKRFARSEVVTSYGAEEVDATKSGPNSPVSKPDARLTTGQVQALLFGIPEAQQASDFLVEDEFECLNLEITVPKNRPAVKKLPVLIFIPGGANTYSFNGIRIYDCSRLVESSVKANKPIITIHVPYRVGLLGYGLLPGGAGGNNALYDQRNAFEWIKRNISAFGGDPENITLSGESAGGFSVDCHIHAKDAQTDKSLQYFKRAIMMSGNLRLYRPMEKEYQLKKSKAVAEAMGFTGKDWAEQLEKAPVGQLLEAQDKLGYTYFHAGEDEEWFEKDVVDLKKTLTPKWVESVMIGDCGFEGFIWVLKFQAQGLTGIVELLESSGPAGEKLLTTYPGIKSENPQYSFMDTLRLLQDILFSHPSYLTSSAYRAAGTPVFEFLFDQVNPWDKSRLAHHGCDLLYWFGAFDLPASETRVCEAMKWSLFSFVNGDEPWPKEGRYGFGPDGYTGEVRDEDWEKRRRLSEYKVLDEIEPKVLFEIADRIQTL